MPIILLFGIGATILWGWKGFVLWLMPGVPPPGPFGEDDEERRS